MEGCATPATAPAAVRACCGTPTPDDRLRHASGRGKKCAVYIRGRKRDNQCFGPTFGGLAQSAECAVSMVRISNPMFRRGKGIETPILQRLFFVPPTAASDALRNKGARAPSFFNKPRCTGRPAARIRVLTSKRILIVSAPERLLRVKGTTRHALRRARSARAAPPRSARSPSAAALARARARRARRGPAALRRRSAAARGRPARRRAARRELVPERVSPALPAIVWLRDGAALPRRAGRAAPVRDRDRARLLRREHRDSSAQAVERACSPPPFCEPARVRAQREPPREGQGVAKHRRFARARAAHRISGARHRI